MIRNLGLLNIFQKISWKEKVLKTWNFWANKMSSIVILLSYRSLWSYLSLLLFVCKNIVVFPSRAVAIESAFRLFSPRLAIVDEHLTRQLPRSWLTSLAIEVKLLYLYLVVVLYFGTKWCKLCCVIAYAQCDAVKMLCKVLPSVMSGYPSWNGHK